MKSEPQKSQPIRREERRSSHANSETHHRPGHSLQGFAFANTKRNEVTSGQHASSSQQTGANLRAVRVQRTGENLRAIESQRMSVNPRAKVVRSHMPASIEIRGHTDNARIGNDEKKSTSGNVFKRPVRHNE